MVQREMHRWVCNYTYHTYMESNPDRMEMELKISERMLNRALKREDSPEARLVFELCMRYFVEHNVDTNEIFKAYFIDEM